MFDMRGYKISVRGVHKQDELPSEAKILVEGEDLGRSPIIALDGEGQILANFADPPPEVADKYRRGALALRDALEAEVS